MTPDDRPREDAKDRLMLGVYRDLAEANQRRARLWAIGWAVAGALLVVSALLGAADLVLRSRLDRAPRQLPVQSTSPNVNAAGALLTIPGQPGAVLTVDRLPPAPPGKVYEVWLMRGAEALPLGLLSPAASGSAALAFNVTPAGYERIAVTEETGEVAAPTGAPLLAGNVRP